MLVVTQTAKQLVRRRLQVNHFGARVQVLPVFGPQHNTAASGHNALRLLREFVNYSGLKIAKAVFALPLEILADRATQALLYDVVGIKEGKLQPPGELPPDGGFT